MTRTGKLTLARAAFVVLACLPAAARAEEILERGDAQYLGWAVSKDKFRTCSGRPMDVSNGRVQRTSRKCSKAQRLEENARRERQSSGLPKLELDGTDPYADFPQLLEAYARAGRTDTGEVFRAAAAWLESNPDDIHTMLWLANMAGNASVKGNNAFLAQGRQYAQRAIAQLEADRRPITLDDAEWAEYKERWRPVLYREAGVLALRAGDTEAVRANMEKAAAVGSSDPAVYFILGEMANEQYNQLAKQYQVTPAGDAKTAMLPKVEASLDQVIELFARAVALSEGHPQYEEAGRRLRQDLTTFYKYRHPNSEAGLEALINKYRMSPRVSPASP